MLPVTGTGAQRSCKGGHAQEMEKCLAYLGCWGKLDKVSKSHDLR